MDYSTGEALVLTQLRAVSGFTSATPDTVNTSRGKWGILNTGKSAFYGIIKPGPVATEWKTSSAKGWDYSTLIQVWQRYKDDGTSLIDLEARVELIKARFDAYRKLGDTTGAIEDSTVTALTEVQERWAKGGNGPSWLMQEITITWKEQTIVTFAE